MEVSDREVESRDNGRDPTYFEDDDDVVVEGAETERCNSNAVDDVVCPARVSSSVAPVANGSMATKRSANSCK